jgi:hypothetical protein
MQHVVRWEFWRDLRWAEWFDAVSELDGSRVFLVVLDSHHYHKLCVFESVNAGIFCFYNIQRPVFKLVNICILISFVQ